MKLTDQNSALFSLEKALYPGSNLLDGRTEKDWLSFLCEFSSLINFYDNNNINRGNWTPFLLKDPVLLLAFISKTRFEKYHSPYLNACTLLESAFVSDEEADISGPFNQLFDQLTEVFMCIRRWVYYMQKSDDEYDLKKYVIGQVNTNYAGYFWAILSLRQHLLGSSLIKGIAAVDTSDFYFFDQRDEKIWKENKNKKPYWDVLNLDPLKKNDPPAIFKALQKAGDILFNFFHAVIRHAPEAYEQLKNRKSKYPDTTLLRTFVHLLKNQQEQLNGITERHLRFYYKDILQQQALPASRDKVVLFAELSKKDAAFQLPAGTLFNAGFDAQKKAVLFSTPEAVSLNPAAITGAYILAKTKSSNGLFSLYLQNVVDPGLLQTDKKGNVLAWDASSSSTLVKPAIAFASPLLLLREGQRKITLTLHFETAIDLQLLQHARYFLSTQLLWLEVQATVKDSTDNGIVNIGIEIGNTQPAIEAFIKDPDALNSLWPLLKIEFTLLPDLAAPPALKRLDITVNVEGIKTFQLYNDYGALTTKTPYPAFGPAPVLNSSFIMGNNEIFSKPLEWLIIGMDWDKLPRDFADYYAQYNDYLDKDVSVYRKGKMVMVEDSSKPRSWFSRFTSGFRRIFSSKPIIPVDARPFNNFCFTVDFNLLQQQRWSKFNMQNAGSTVITRNFASSYEDQKNYVAAPSRTDLLFTVNGQDRHLTGSSFFCYSGEDAIQPDVNIQLAPLKFTDASTSGFMKIVLSAPSHGFGAEIYPAVVTYTALQNAKLATRRWRKPAFTQLPNPPFTPKAKNLTASYAASHTYDFTQTSTAYPLQCFLYSPFAHYKVYDGSEPAIDFNYTMEKLRTENDQASGIPLFHAFKYDNCIFLQVEQLIPSEVNLYFELSGGSGGSMADKAIDYFYMAKGGWKSLPVLSDDTNNFRCSGIIKANVPGDISIESPVMPSGKYWITVAAKGQATSFPKIVLARTNGFVAARSSNLTASTETPVLAGASITKPQMPVPQIASVTQPFASFDGKASESEQQMYLRISQRLKTKDRITSADDILNLVHQAYPEIYYAQPVFNPYTKNITVYLAKAYENEKQAGAFFPLVSACTEIKIRDFLNQRISGCANTNVSNFDFQYVRVTATIKIKAGFKDHSVLTKVNDALNIFLSPWISSDAPQVTIKSAINDVQVAAFIKSIDGVEEVGHVLFQTLDANASKAEIGESLYQHSISPAISSILFISYMDHALKTINS
ncbi:MAG: hypothetical protein WCF67_25720 [Chitinophagaceae bacterium]